MDMLKDLLKINYILIFKVASYILLFNLQIRDVTGKTCGENWQDTNLWDSNQILFDNRFTNWTLLNLFGIEWGKDNMKLSHFNLRTHNTLAFLKNFVILFFLTLIFLIFVTSLRMIPTLNGKQDLINLSKVSLSGFLVRLLVGTLFSLNCLIPFIPLRIWFGTFRMSLGVAI